MQVAYNPDDPENTVKIQEFHPFQLKGPSAYRSFIRCRSQFSTDEWLALLMETIGYSSEVISNRRARLLMLCRLIPLVQKNYNLIELGPRQTGKTFLLRNLSPQVHLLSSGKTSAASLFYNLARKTVGILGHRKVVIFDEISHATFGLSSDLLSTLKDYMESGLFGRSEFTGSSDASIVFTGNLDVQDDLPHPRYPHLFNPLPSELIDTALLDRLHAYIRGWEMPKIGENIAQNYGFVTDFFADVLSHLRSEDVLDVVRQVRLLPGLTHRDRTAVERTAAGLCKLIYPDQAPKPEELLELVNLACELRQRVHNQLVRMAPGEFKSRHIGPLDSSGHAAPDLRDTPIQLSYVEDRPNREAIIGMVTGLGVITQGDAIVGGETVIIEVSAHRGPASVKVTGQAAAVMRDSIQAVYNMIRAAYSQFGIQQEFVREQTIAVHLVRMSEPRDGPSAGLAFALGMISALTRRPVAPGIAVTGEVSLHGQVTAVGGLEQKLFAAKRAGRSTVFLPFENRRDIAMLPRELLTALNLRQVSIVSDLLWTALLPASR